jgi:hypothetical protein
MDLLHLNIRPAGCDFPFPLEFGYCGFNRRGNSVHEARGRREWRKGFGFAEDRGVEIEALELAVLREGRVYR